MEQSPCLVFRWFELHAWEPGANKNETKTKLKGSGSVKVNEKEDEAESGLDAERARPPEDVEASRKAVSSMMDMMRPVPCKVMEESSSEGSEQATDDEDENADQKKKGKKGKKKTKKTRKPQEIGEMSLVGASIPFTFCKGSLYQGSCVKDPKKKAEAEKKKRINKIRSAYLA